MDRLTMSLDDLIANKVSAGSNKRRNDNNHSGPTRGGHKKQSMRSAPYEDRQRRNDAPVRRVPQENSNNQQLSVFARIGKPLVSGTSVTFANLKASVGEKDIQDLCSAIGEVKEVELSSGRTGKNTATVLFARRSDATTCVTKLNGMTLDGFPMEVGITGEPAEFTAAPKSVFDRLQPAGQQNVRAGLFGTAMDSEGETSSQSGPSFAVTLGGSSDSFGRQTKLVQPFAVGGNHSNNHSNSNARGLVQPFAAKKEFHPESAGRNFLFRDESDDSNTQQVTRGLRQPFNEGRQQSQNQNQNQNRPRSGSNQQDARRGNNNGPRGGRNSNNNNKAPRAERVAKPAASAIDLDADLDAYFKK